VPYDDPIMVRDNANLRAGLSREGLRWAFGSVHGANWIPVTWVTYLADQEISGLAPGGVHATNVLLHALSALLLFAAFLRATGAPFAAFFVAGVFALHPIQVETVAWASERKGLAAGVFWMGALLAHVSGGKGPRSAARIAALAALMAAGLLAKGVLVTLPFALLLADLWPLGRLARGDRAVDRAALRSALLEKAPLFALAALGSLATFLAQRAGGATASLERLPLGDRLANVPVAYLRYLGKLVFPSGLAPFYPHPEGGVGAAAALCATAVLLAATALALRAVRARPYVTFGWLWFLGVLVPMIGFVQVGSQALADRYAYLPIVGIAAAVGFACGALARGGPRLAQALGAAAVLVPLALGVLAAEQRALWRDGRTLFVHALRATGPDNWVAHEQLGAAWLEEGRTAEGIAELEQALRLRPRSASLLNNVAWLLATSPDPKVRAPARAVQLARRAQEVAGTSATSLDTLAAAYAAAGRFAEAERTQREALRMAEAEPDAPLAAYRERLARYAVGDAFVAPPPSPSARR
jgi:tetratricopeptide (TPR) repeat protein